MKEDTIFPKKVYLNHEEDDKIGTLCSSLSAEKPVNSADYHFEQREYVDLSQVWHDAEERPRVPNGYRWVRILVHGKATAETVSYGDGWKWRNLCEEYMLLKWAYVSDLLPKTNGINEKN